jgi:hypothetical protein
MRQVWLSTIIAVAISLAAMPAVMAYTAVAVSEKLAYGYCNNMQSVGEATECAMKYCRQSATDPQTCAVGLQSEPNGHYSLAIGGGGWGVASGDSEAEADRSALGYCRSEACVVVARWTEGIVRGQ